MNNVYNDVGGPGNYLIPSLGVDVRRPPRASPRPAHNVNLADVLYVHFEEWIQNDTVSSSTCLAS